jgi:hypothetical protein
MWSRDTGLVRGARKMDVMTIGSGLCFLTWLRTFW